MRFESEITAPVTVEVLDAEAPSAGRYTDAPERCFPSGVGSVALQVTLGGVDITAALAPDVLEALRDEAIDLATGLR